MLERGVFDLPEGMVGVEETTPVAAVVILLGAVETVETGLERGSTFPNPLGFRILFIYDETGERIFSY